MKLIKPSRRIIRRIRRKRFVILSGYFLSGEEDSFFLGDRSPRRNWPLRKEQKRRGFLSLALPSRKRYYHLGRITIYR
jgi:hypothetical protein